MQALAAEDAPLSTATVINLSLNTESGDTIHQQVAVHMPGEFDANLFYNIMADAARTASIKAGVAPEEVAAISATSQRGRMCSAG